jgi:hypothetical protein
VQVACLQAIAAIGSAGGSHAGSADAQSALASSGLTAVLVGNICADASSEISIASAQTLCSMACMGSFVAEAVVAQGPDGFFASMASSGLNTASAELLGRLAEDATLTSHVATAEILKAIVAMVATPGLEADALKASCKAMCVPKGRRSFLLFLFPPAQPPPLRRLGLTLISASLVSASHMNHHQVQRVRQRGHGSGRRRRRGPRGAGGRHPHAPPGRRRLQGRHGGHLRTGCLRRLGRLR